MDLASLSDQIAAAVEHAAGSVVAVSAREHLTSSGVAWRPDAIVTADHTIRRDDDITVFLPGGRSVPATLAGRDPGTDLAVLKVENLNLPRIEPAPVNSARPGNLVLAVGRGAISGVNAAMGIVSAVGGAWRTWRGGLLDQLIRLDLALYGKLSGGAVLDHQGRLLGIATSGLTRAVGVAIPSTTVERVAAELLAAGRVRRGYLGVGLHPVKLPDTLVKKLDLAEPAGLLVITIEAGGPADQGGVLLGDILVSIDGRRVTDTDDVQAALGGDSVGKALRAGLVRGGAAAEATVTPRERPRAGA